MKANNLDGQNSELIVIDASDDYELIDFGDGRKLERYGDFLVERPCANAKIKRKLETWQAHWNYKTVAAFGEWQSQPNKKIPTLWPIQVHGLHFMVGPGQDCAQKIQPVANAQLMQEDQTRAELGFAAEQLACWHWLKQKISACYDLAAIRVLNLFGGNGGLSLLAYQHGAQVSHVDPCQQRINRLQPLFSDTDVVTYVDGVRAFVDKAIRQNLKYDMVILRPPVRENSLNKQSWDIKVDLIRLLEQLPRICSEQCLGVWVSPLVQDLSATSLAELLNSYFPEREIQAGLVSLRASHGGLLPSMAVAYWDEAYVQDAQAAMDKLNAEQIETRLDVYLDAILSSRRSASEPAARLAGLTREAQDMVLHWVEVISRTNAEMAYQFANYANDACAVMDLQAVQDWALAAIDSFDTEGLYKGIAVLQQLNEFAQACRDRQTAAVFDDYASILEHYVHGLQGRRMQLKTAQFAYTDTEAIYLPAILNDFNNSEQNYLLYKCLTTYLWAQNYYGTWRWDLLSQSTLQTLASEPKKLGLFCYLECLRLHAIIARTLPGVFKHMQALNAINQYELISQAFQSAYHDLAKLDSTVASSLNILEKYQAMPIPTLPCYAGSVQVSELLQNTLVRIEKEKQEFQSMLATLAMQANKQNQKRPTKSADDDTTVRRATKLDNLSQAQQTKQDKNNSNTGLEKNDSDNKKINRPGFKINQNGTALEFEVDGIALAPPIEANALLQSILQDFGAIPPDYLHAAGDGVYQMQAADSQQSRTVWSGTYHEQDAYLYQEWDCKRQTYRKNWCVLREAEVTGNSLDFYHQTLTKYSGLLQHIRRLFEALRGDEKMLKKQVQGDDVDIDALVEAFADMQSGLELSERLFLKRRKVERNIAVMFMVDLSGSTKGWINEAEREALILLSEALQTLGDHYAIYGFSGMTRKRCELYKIKRFDENYDDEIKRRICALEPQDYTRMGVVIRHLSKLLNEVEAKTKLLITLSDGKPDDFDGYRGEYGIEDTRKALIEAKQNGIHSYCITIDREAGDYLPYMYGAVNYIVIDEIRKLPLKVSDIYRKLTS